MPCAGRERAGGYSALAPGARPYTLDLIRVHLVHPFAIAGFLSALAVAHSTVAVYSLVLYGRQGRAEPPAPRPPAPSRPRRDRELVVFGLLNLAVVAHDAGLARVYALADSDHQSGLAAALLLAEAGRVGAVVFLLHFILLYARAPRPAAALAALYGAGGLVALAGLGGALVAPGEPRWEQAWILGVIVPYVSPGAGLTGVIAGVGTAVAALAALAILGRAFLRGRREAMGFVGLTLLAVAVVHDALRGAGWAVGPPVSPFGYATFVNGVIMTLLARFAALRAQLEARAGELKDRARDLSRAYIELRAAQDELVRKEQLTAVGELSAVVAHEVRNPLAIIANAVATLRRTTVGEADREVLLGILDEESSRLNHIVGDLLRYSRPINPQRQLVALRELVERGLSLAEGKLDLEVELVEPEPTEKVWADANLIRQVIENLIDNALQAMSSGGVLTLTLLGRELDGARGVEIQIQDTGEGMDTQVRARALDPFFTTRPKGTGLGLAIVARIVEAHGGALRIESKAGAGTVMHVFLPRGAEGPVTLRPPPRQRASLTDVERRSSEPPLPAELRKAMGMKKA